MVSRSLSERVVALGWMNAQVCRAETEEEALVAAGRHVHSLFRADWAGLGLRSVDKRRLRLTALPKNEEPLESGTDLPVESLMMHKVADNGSTFASIDLDATHFRDLEGLAAAGMCSALVVPLRTGTQTIGAMVLARRRPEAFDEGDRLLASQASAFLASAILNFRAIALARRVEADRDAAERTLAERASEFDLLNRLLATPVDDDSPSGYCEQVVDGLVSLPGIDLCRIVALDRIGAIWVMTSASDGTAGFGDAGPVLHASSPEGIVIATNRVAVWRKPAPADREAARTLRSLQVSSVFSVPITLDGNVIGALTAASTGSDALVSDEHITLASIAAPTLAAMMQRDPDYVRRRRSAGLAPASELLAKLSG